MAQPEFYIPDFLEGSSAEEIHERMMENLPDDIDDMEGGFAYDFTKPAAIEKAEIIEFHLMRAIMIAFPQYAWDEWLDNHAAQVHLTRQEEHYASGAVTITGTAGTVISAGTVVCVPAVDDSPAIEYATDEDCIIDEEGTVTVDITAVESGIDSNIAANTICIMAKSNKDVLSVNNEKPVTGGTEKESNDAFYDRIFAEYNNSLTYLGNDSDYVRWAKEAGAGDCIVIPAFNGPGTVKLVLVDANCQPANERLMEDVYNYIVSPGDRTKRLLPTACAQLMCSAAATVAVNYTITGLQFDETTSIEKIKTDFIQIVKTVYDTAKNEGLLRYNDVRPLISGLAGVDDFGTFLINGEMNNIQLGREEYPETGILDFS